MKSTRKQHKPEFKAQVALEALEALRGDKTVAELAQSCLILPSRRRPLSLPVMGFEVQWNGKPG